MIGSCCCVDWYFSQTLHFPKYSFNSADIPGQYTVSLVCLRPYSDLKWASSWSDYFISFLQISGIIIVSPFSRNPLSNEKYCLTDQYGWIHAGRAALSSGHPCTTISWRAWRVRSSRVAFCILVISIGWRSTCSISFTFWNLVFWFPVAGTDALDSHCVC